MQLRYHLFWCINGVLFGYKELTAKEPIIAKLDRGEIDVHLLPSRNDIEEYVGSVYGPVLTAVIWLR